LRQGLADARLAPPAVAVPTAGRPRLVL